jgi:HEAT repeat protein
VEKPARVGIALHPHMEIEPELSTRVALLIRQLDDERFETREGASKMLASIGPMAIGMMREALAKNPSLELRRRIETILNNVDAAEWLRPVAPVKPVESNK